jgi:hypothetical protein
VGVHPDWNTLSHSGAGLVQSAPAADARPQG